MTERKPPDKTWHSWVEEQIRQAQDDGRFDALEGKGRPIQGLEDPYDPLWWVKKLIDREKLSALPLALEIRARVERELEVIWTLTLEDEVRERLDSLSAEIARVNRMAAEDPPTSLSPIDVQAFLERWRREVRGRPPGRSGGESRERLGGRHA